MKKAAWCCVLPLVLVSSSAWAQACKCPPGDSSVSRVHVARDSGRVRLTGVIVDAETTRPIQQVLIGLQLRPGDKGSAALTDSTGTFRIDVVSAGSFQMQIARIEYASVELTVDASTDSLHFVMAKHRPSFCPLIVSGQSAQISLMLRNADSGQPVAGSVAVKAYHWISGVTLDLAIQPAQGATRLSITQPGPYTLLAQAAGYAPWVLRRTFVWRDPCMSTAFLDNRIEGRMTPLR